MSTLQLEPHIIRPSEYNSCPKCRGIKAKRARLCLTCTIKRPQVVQPSDENVRLIALTKGQVCMVDAEDYEAINKWHWQAIWHPRTRSFYAARGTHIANPRRQVAFKMHRVILGLNENDNRQVDHANGNTLDNRKINLRIATPSQNSANRKMRATNTSGYKGVSFYARSSKWKAQIAFEGRKYHLGYFDTKEGAYDAYCMAALDIHGEFARVI